ncbi:MAG: hypothetical protein A2V70_11815 [Planctomycetes bacterium RBG_13_63_9]|nr:MAG: hypothetical protein A2V70_11815 [Planctomycetes bacterium RBG_13_63_9]
MRHGLPAVWVVLLALLASGIDARSVVGYTPESPEVKEAVVRAVEFLESDAAKDNRLGAKALVGMALLKSGARRSHPKIVKAVEAIREDSAGKGAEQFDADIYSTGLSVIFLVTLDPKLYATEIEYLLESLRHRQKPHGGWGYPGRETGDTSMTQYGVLSAWEAAQAGFDVPIESIERVATWLLKTQDPSGGFGYQGNVSASFVPVGQDSTTLSLGAAGLGSVYMCIDLLGLMERVDLRDAGLPAALRQAQGEKSPERVKAKTKLDPALFRAVQARGDQWMQQNYRIDPPRYAHYYLYALERYMSFRELSMGIEGVESGGDGPKWYNDGVRFLIDGQAENGSWRGSCQAVVDTSFGVLFLLRSMKRSIEKSRGFGDGVLVGGRGLPKESDRAVVRGGKVVPRPLLGPAEQLLAVLESTKTPDYEQAIDLLAELPPERAAMVTRKYAQKLRRLAGDESPEARITAVRALAKVRDVDNVPTLIYALTDPSPVVVREARDALRRVSRNPAGFGLPDQPTEGERGAAIEKWKSWYLAIRPDAEFAE